VAVAHGSRDPRSARSVAELVARVRLLRPDLAVYTAFLDLSAPRLTDVLAGLHADGHRHAVVVPLLLGSAFHARVDLPGLLASARRRMPRLAVSTSDVLGPDGRLELLLRQRLAESAGSLVDSSLGIVVSATGSSRSDANAEVVALTRRLATTVDCVGARAAFATSTPSVADAVTGLRAAGAGRIAVASWFLAPGLLPDRVRAQAAAVDPDVVVAAPLGADPLLARVILDRYDVAATAATAARYA